MKKSLSSLAIIPGTNRPAARTAVLRMSAHERMPPSLQTIHKIGFGTSCRKFSTGCRRRLPLAVLCLQLRQQRRRVPQSHEGLPRGTPGARGRRNRRKQTKGKLPIAAKPAFRAAAAPAFACRITFHSNDALRASQLSANCPVPSLDPSSTTISNAGCLL